MIPYRGGGAVAATRAAAVIVAIVTLMAVYVPSAAADAAPSPYSPGSAPFPRGRDRETNVAMISEDVLVRIDDADAPTRPGGETASDAIVGYVDAEFVMRNQGSEAESIAVWFPLQRDEYHFAISDSFTASVDGVPASVTVEEIGGNSFSADEVWASWPATFPPGQDVVLRVTYELRPTGYTPYGTFGYVLDTGAGWRGPIGNGTVTFRLPYDVNSTNTSLAPPSTWDYDTGILPPGFQVSGTDIVWTFNDLEPTEDDNIRLTVLTPRVWRELVRAREAAAAEPDSASAKAALGRALDAALLVAGGGMGVVWIADSRDLEQEAAVAFGQAVELAPNDVEVLLDYLDFFLYTPGFMAYGDAPESYREILERAIVLAPDDERVQFYREWRDDTRDISLIVTLTPMTAGPGSTGPTGGTGVPVSTADTDDTAGAADTADTPGAGDGAGAANTADIDATAGAAAAANAPAPEGASPSEPGSSATTANEGLSPSALEVALLLTVIVVTIAAGVAARSIHHRG